MTPVQQRRLSEIVRLLDEAYDHYFAHGEGHHKGSEGYVEVRYPNYFERKDGAVYPEAIGVGVYSYVLGPSRMHHFTDFGEALAEVRRWHKAQVESECEAHDCIEHKKEEA